MPTEPELPIFTAPDDELAAWLADASVGTRGGGPTMRPKQEGSPYFGHPENEWPGITRGLIAAHPLDGPELVDAVLRSWDAIFESRIGSGFHIGKEIKPAPQIMGFLLHALIPLELAVAHPDWRADLTSGEKDLVHVPDMRYSVEIKTSSHQSQIFGNRSFGVDNPGKGKKAKDGYYLTVNFEKWSSAVGRQPKVLLVRFGWLDSTDWVAQRAETGQQSALPSAVDNYQLLTLYKA